jgi:hypothetical protein
LLLHAHPTRPGMSYHTAPTCLCPRIGLIALNDDIKALSVRLCLLSYQMRRETWGATRHASTRIALIQDTVRVGTSPWQVSRHSCNSLHSDILLASWCSASASGLPGSVAPWLRGSLYVILRAKALLDWDTDRDGLMGDSGLIWQYWHCLSLIDHLAQLLFVPFTHLYHSCPVEPAYQLHQPVLSPHSALFCLSFTCGTPKVAFAHCTLVPSYPRRLTAMDTSGTECVMSQCHSIPVFDFSYCPTNATHLYQIRVPPVLRCPLPTSVFSCKYAFYLSVMGDSEG